MKNKKKLDNLDKIDRIGKAIYVIFAIIFIVILIIAFAPGSFTNGLFITSHGQEKTDKTESEMIINAYYNHYIQSINDFEKFKTGNSIISLEKADKALEDANKMAHSFNEYLETHKDLDSELTKFYPLPQIENN